MKLPQKLCLYLWLIFIPLFVAHANAESLMVAVSPENREFFPETFERVMRALNNTGYDIELVELPRKRSLLMLERGEISMELGMPADVIPEGLDLIQIKPAVVDITITMVTSDQTPEFCEEPEEKFAEMTFANTLGLKFFDIFYAPKFSKSFNLRSYQDMFEMVALGRADVTFVAMKTIHLIPEDIKSRLIICGTHVTKITSYSYLHKNYGWAKDKIEAAYETEFGDQ